MIFVEWQARNMMTMVERRAAMVPSRLSVNNIHINIADINNIDINIAASTTSSSGLALCICLCADEMELCMRVAAEMER